MVPKWRGSRGVLKGHPRNQDLLRLGSSAQNESVAKAIVSAIAIATRRETHFQYWTWSLFSTLVTPGAAQAAIAASSFSLQE